MLTVQLEPELLRNTHIFPASAVTKPSPLQAGWIGFHGTTTERAAQIEKEGCIRAFKALNAGEVRILCETGRALLEAHAIAEPDVFERLLDDAKKFPQRAAINFFSVSVQALEHTKTRGGQAKQSVLRRIATEILSNQGFPRNHTNREPLEAIAQILAIQDGTPVVYAVNLEGLHDLWYDDAQTAIHINGPILSRRIVARLNAPYFTEADYSTYRMLEGGTESRGLAGRMSNSQHFTATLPTEPPGALDHLPPDH